MHHIIAPGRRKIIMPSTLFLNTSAVFLYHAWPRLIKSILKAFFSLAVFSFSALKYHTRLRRIKATLKQKQTKKPHHHPHTRTHPPQETHTPKITHTHTTTFKKSTKDSIFTTQIFLLNPTLLEFHTAYLDYDFAITAPQAQ